MEGVRGSSQEDLGVIPALTQPRTKPTTQQVLTGLPWLILLNQRPTQPCCPPPYPDCTLHNLRPGRV